MTTGGDGLHSIPHPVWDSRRLWSLADMINFYLGSFLHTWNDLTRALAMARHYAEYSDGFVNDKFHEGIQITGENVIKECEKLRLSDTTTACWQLDHMFRAGAFQQYKWSDLAHAIDRLHGDLSVALSGEYFFHYPSDEAL